MIQLPPKEFWNHFKEAKGAMSSAEAIFLYNACLMAPDEGVWVEMGTYHGKSALVSLMAWVNRDKHSFFLLEPEFKDVDFLNVAQSNVLKFKQEFGGNTACHFNAEYSTEFLPKFDNYSYLMWDSGDHGLDLVSAEKPLLENKMIKGGIIVMHDINSQFTACTDAYNGLIATGNYEPIEIDWQPIFDYVAEHDLENGNNSWHQYPDLGHPPNFIGALKRK